MAVPQAHDGRRLEIVADGLPLFGQPTLLCVFLLLRRGGAHDNLQRERAHLRSTLGISCLSALGGLWQGEVGGRWVRRTKSFIGQLAKAKVRSEPRILSPAQGF